MKLLLLEVAIAVIVYLTTSGHVIFLPLILVLPLGWLFRRKTGLTIAAPAKLDLGQAPVVFAPRALQQVGVELP